MRRFGSGSIGQGVIIQPGWELVTDRFGLVTGQVRFKVTPKKWQSFPRVGSAHPGAGFCFMDRRKVVTSPGFWTIVGDYTGVEVEASDKVFELQRSTRQEPIETHPEFVTQIGGKPSAPKNGAIFVDETGFPTSDDEIGVFENFRISIDGSRNPLAGADSYLAPTNTVWTAQWTSRAKPSPGANVGKIDNSPTGGPPDYGDGWSWLYTGLAYTERAGAYSARESWLLGRWIPTVYSGS